jgi:5-methylcytosine-specific restriction endonuclease McrA
MKYADKLKDPRWQKKRLEVFQRDGFSCRACGDTTKTLNVHHLRYKKGGEPWESPLSDLMTLCEYCHEEETNRRADFESALLEMLRARNWTCQDIEMLTRSVMVGYIGPWFTGQTGKVGK